MFGQNIAGLETTIRSKTTLGYNPLPFAKQIGQDADIAGHDVMSAIGNGEHVVLSVPCPAAVLDQSTEADRLAWCNFARDHVTGRVEEHDLVTQGR